MDQPKNMAKELLTLSTDTRDWILATSAEAYVSTQELESAKKKIYELECAARSSGGTLSCPICGIDEVHGHNDKDIINWLNAQISRFNRALMVVKTDGLDIIDAYKRIRNAYWSSLVDDQEQPNPDEDEVMGILIALRAETPEARTCKNCRGRHHERNCDACNSGHHLWEQEPTASDGKGES